VNRRPSPAAALASLVAAAALPGACAEGGGIAGGFGVELTITADATISDDMLLQATRLEFVVSGSESSSDTVPLDRSLRRTERITYRPRPEPRQHLYLTFDVTARSAWGQTVAVGSTAADLDPGQLVPATVTLGACPQREAGPDVYIDASAPAFGTGSAGCPFRTITEAVRVLGATSQILHVAGGTYDASLGEMFPITLRDTSIEGTADGDVLIIGQASPDDGGETIVVSNRTLATRIANVVIQPDPTQFPQTGSVGVRCIVGGPDGPALTLDRVALGPGYETALLTEEQTLLPCSVAMIGSTVSGNLRGIWHGSGAGTIEGCDRSGAGALLAVGDGTIGGKNSFTANGFSDQIGSGGAAILVSGCGVAEIDGNMFANNSVGIRIDQAASTIRHRIVGNAFMGHTRNGIELARGAVIDRLVGNAFEQNTSPSAATAPAAGLLADDWSQVTTARKNTFRHNDYGVWFRGRAFGTGRPSEIDFGKPTDWGGNVFVCNSLPTSSGLGGAAPAITGGYDFAITTDPEVGGRFWLYGNGWNSPAPIVVATGEAPTGADLYVAAPSAVTIEGLETAAVVDPPPHCPRNRAP
jgi:hypothetical protein